jgi:lauroyl/myristoyl acyltransferase
MNSESQPGANLIVPLDPDEPLPWAGPGEAVRRALRRVTPSGLAVRWAARPRRFAEDELREARLAMEAIVAHTPRAGEVEELAVAWLREQAAIEEMFWRPWLLRRRRWSGTEHRDEALATGRGVLFSYVHRGPFHSLPDLVPDRERRLIDVTGDFITEPAPPNRWGRRLVLMRRVAARTGLTVLLAPGSFPALVALLERGERVMIAFDMPGGHRMTWLGKPVDISMGTARLAWMTGSPIVPVWLSRDGARHVGEFGEVLHPEDHGSLEELQEALAAAHERAVLEAPEMLENPRRPGAWEEGATADGWFRPQRGGPA